MKSLILLTTGLLFLSATSFAAGNVQVDIRTSGDTLTSEYPAALEIWIANDMQMGGFQIPLTLSSPDGVTWTWNSQPAVNAW